MFALALLILNSCATQQQQPILTGGFQLAQTGRIYARPGDVKTPSHATGMQKLHLGGERDGLIYVPPAYQAPVPLILMLTAPATAARSS